MKLLDSKHIILTNNELDALINPLDNWEVGGGQLEPFTKRVMTKAVNLMGHEP